jgi:hypothetical protein
MREKYKRANDTTIASLQNWTEAQKVPERLCAAILHLENYKNLEPSHPTGGPDSGKDLICNKDNKKFIGAVSFNRDVQPFTKVKNKFKKDLLAASKHEPDGIIFFTNQRISITERKSLSDLTKNEMIVEVYDLERIAGILSTPKGYGVRLEYLHIEMSIDEQVSFFAERDVEINKLNNTLKELLSALEKSGGMPSISIEKLNEFKMTLELITGGGNNIYGYNNSMIDKLKIPLFELREFRQELNAFLAGQGFLTPTEKLKVPIDDLINYRDVLNQILNLNSFAFSRKTPSEMLAVPLDQISSYYKNLMDIRSLRMGLFDPLNIDNVESYNNALDSTIVKLNEIKKLKEEIKNQA